MVTKFKKPAKWNRADFQAKNDHRYKTVCGDRCVYCLEKAVLLDHVPALYDVYKNGTEPQCKVPSCYQCNQNIGADGTAEPVYRIVKAMGENASQGKAIMALASQIFASMEEWARFLAEAPNVPKEQIWASLFGVAGHNASYVAHLTEYSIAMLYWQDGAVQIYYEGMGDDQLSHL